MNIQWRTSAEPVDYETAQAEMQAHVAELRAGGGEELIWLLQHPPLYTAGSSAKSGDLLQQNNGLPVYNTGRGGQYTYHGPGQRIAYLMLDLNRRSRDLRLYVQQLQDWIIATLAEFGVQGVVRDGRIGVWVQTAHGEAKIAAIGVRAQQWVVSHGIAINVNPNLQHYQGIVPCGIREFGVTSLADLGLNVTMAELDAALRKTCPF